MVFYFVEYMITISKALSQSRYKLLQDSLIVPNGAKLSWEDNNMETLGGIIYVDDNTYLRYNGGSWCKMDNEVSIDLIKNPVIIIELSAEESFSLEKLYKTQKDI